jgi:hypothetical protein
MKSRCIMVLIFTILCISSIPTIIINPISAEDNSYNISIVGKNYTIARIHELPGDDLVFFNISITLRNSGSQESDNMTVEIQDEEMGTNFIHTNGTISPGQIKTFYFLDYPINGMIEHRINISYHPTFESIEWTEFNHGTDVLVLLPEKKNETTPGFEIVFIFLALILYISYKKFKQ